MNENTPPSKGKIVIAEDDAATRMLLSAVLTKAQFTVFAVENGQLAYEAVLHEKPDVILMDWMMPVLDGRAAVEMLKANVITRGIPVVMLTTQTQIEERVAALESGVQDFLCKPFDPRELVARIEQQMRWRRLLAVDANTAFGAERLKQLYTGSESRREKPPDTPDFFDRIWGGDAKPAKGKAAR
jgi:two-component system phosphate regulon response regulator PhoB